MAHAADEYQRLRHRHLTNGRALDEHAPSPV